MYDFSHGMGQLYKVHIAVPSMYEPPRGKTMFLQYMSHLVEKPTMWFPNRSDTNRPVQAKKRARSLKFRI